MGWVQDTMSAVAQARDKLLERGEKLQVGFLPPQFGVCVFMNGPSGPCFKGVVSNSFGAMFPSLSLHIGMAGCDIS